MTDDARPPRPLRLPTAGDPSSEAARRRREVLAEAGIETSRLAGEGAEPSPEELATSIEGFVGFARVPVGVFGPLRVEGEHADGDYYVPVATTEGALVQSFQHVANAVGRAGGFRARCTDGVVWRAPGFVFTGLRQAAAFAGWLPGQRAALERVVAEGSGHCRLTAVVPAVVGREVYLRLGFETGDAAGQNMVTKAASAACTLLLDEMPDKPEHWQLESNFSGDKKATVLALQTARGKRASAEATLPDKLCRRYFRAGAADLARAWSLAVTGAVQSGTVGVQANAANALAGLFVACGQDVACVAEASAAITRAELTPEGDLYVSTTLPGLIVGTVGGGTYLPTARECLAMIDCAGAGKAKRFAELCACVVLAGEIALMGAMAGGSYATAHAEVGKRGESTSG